MFWFRHAFISSFHHCYCCAGTGDCGAAATLPNTGTDGCNINDLNVFFIRSSFVFVARSVSIFVRTANGEHAAAAAAAAAAYYYYCYYYEENRTENLLLRKWF